MKLLLNSRLLSLSRGTRKDGVTPWIKFNLIDDENVPFSMFGSAVCAAKCAVTPINKNICAVTLTLNATPDFKGSGFRIMVDDIKEIK